MLQNINREKIINISKKIGKIIFSLLLLLIGLDLIKHVLLGGLHQEFLNQFFVSPTKSFFVSYLMTEISMTGSPIAWAFISLSETLRINIQNLAAIIMGTRWGVNSFLFITGLLMLFKGKSLRRSLGMTVIQFFVTLSVTLLSAVFLFPLLNSHIMHIPAQFFSQWLVLNWALDTIISPISHLIQKSLSHDIGIAITGVFFLIGGLFMFDKSFSFLKEKKNKEILDKFESSKTAFISGFLITALTMSLSISVTILLPLYIRKYIDRKLLIAYILWANISTLFDTLFLGIMTKSTTGVEVILAFIIAVSISVIIYLLIFKRYYKSIGHITDQILKNKYRFFIFTLIIMLVPILFLIK